MVSFFIHQEKIPTDVYITVLLIPLVQTLNQNYPNNKFAETSSYSGD
jgi:hypothetical protein